MWAARSTGGLKLAKGPRSSISQGLQGSHHPHGHGRMSLLHKHEEPLHMLSSASQSSPSQSSMHRSGECVLKDVMCIVSKLLRHHEVKLALQLVDNFATAPIAFSVLSVTRDELKEAFARFVSRRHAERSSPEGGDGMSELERCARGNHEDATASANDVNRSCTPHSNGNSIEECRSSTESAVIHHPLAVETTVHPIHHETASSLRPASLKEMGPPSQSHPPPLLVEEAGLQMPQVSGSNDFENCNTLQSVMAIPDLPLTSLPQCSETAPAPSFEGTLGRLMLEECDGVCDERPASASKVANLQAETPQTSASLVRPPESKGGLPHPGSRLNLELKVDNESTVDNRSTTSRMMSWVGSSWVGSTLRNTFLNSELFGPQDRKSQQKSVVPVQNSLEDLTRSKTTDTGMGKTSASRNAELQESWYSIPSNRFLFSPNGSFKIVWDIFSLLFIVNESIIVPLSLCFEIDAGQVIFWISTSFFTVDIVLNFFTGYFNDGVLVMKHRYIIKNYAKTWFGLDAASTFPWHMVFSSGNATLLKFAKFGKLTRVLRLLRVAKLTMLIEQLEELFASSGVVIMLKLMKILAFMGLLCHWVACTWGWIGHPERYIGEFARQEEQREGFHDSRRGCEPGGPCEPMIYGSAWRRRYGLEDNPLAEQYLYALRFAAGIFTGSDFGIQPGFWAEWLYVVILMFASFILCSTIVSKIVIIFHKMNQDRHEQEELMLSFKEFMVAGRVPFQLQAKIKRYLEYQFRSRKDLQIRRFELMEKLSPWLRKELQVHLNRGVLSLHSFFRDMPGEILAHTCCLATCVLCAPGDVVMQRGQQIQCMYFVVKGKLTIDIDDGEAQEADLVTQQKTQASGMLPGRATLFGKRMTSMEEGGTELIAPGYIGASSLFRDEVRPYTVSSLAHSELLKLAREDIEALLQEFPALRSYFENYRAQQGASVEGYQDCSLSYLKQRKTRLTRSTTTKSEAESIQTAVDSM